MRKKTTNPPMASTTFALNERYSIGSYKSDTIKDLTTTILTSKPVHEWGLSLRASRAHRESLSWMGQAASGMIWQKCPQSLVTRKTKMAYSLHMKHCQLRIVFMPRSPSVSCCPPTGPSARRGPPCGAVSICNYHRNFVKLRH